MADDAHLTFELSPEHAASVRAAVDAGDYPDETAAVRDVFDRWSAMRMDQDARVKAALERRMATALASIERGEGLTVDRVRSRLGLFSVPQAPGSSA